MLEYFSYSLKRMLNEQTLHRLVPTSLPHAYSFNGFIFDNACVLAGSSI